MVKNRKKNIFYKPIKLRDSSFFFKSNKLEYFRFMVIVPKYIIKKSSERNYFKRTIKNFILKSHLSEINLDMVLFIHEKPINKNKILHTINNIWYDIS